MTEIKLADLDDDNLVRSDLLPIFGTVDLAAEQQTTARQRLGVGSPGFLPLEGVDLADTTVVPIDVLADGMLYGADDTTLKRSDDKGVTWTTVQDLGAGKKILAIRDAGDGEVLVSRFTDGLYRSSGWDSDPTTATFTKVATPSGTGAYFLPWGIAVALNDGLVLLTEYAANYVDSKVARLSTDHGATFTTIHTLADETSDADTAHYHLAMIDPWADNRLWISWHHSSVSDPRGVYYSDDQGDTWTAATTSYQPTTATPTDQGIVFGSDSVTSGVFVVERVDADTPINFRVAWLWRAATAGLNGFAYRGWRDPDTGVVYVGFVANEGVAPIVAASDGVIADSIWASGDAAPSDSDGLQNLVVVDGTIIGSCVSNNASTATWQQVTADTRPRGTRPSAADDAGHVLGGSVDNALSTAVGVGATVTQAASTTGGVAVGAGAATTGSQGTAVGWQAEATAGSSLAIGDNASSTQADGIAIGPSAASTAAAGQARGVAIGASSSATGGSGVVIGASATDNGTSTTVSIGYQASSAAHGVAVGGTASANGSGISGAVAVGYGATATANNAIAIGNGTAAANGQSVAIGAGTLTTSSNQVALGARHVEIGKVTAPGAPAAATARLFVQDNGSGKMQLAVRFPTGSVQVLATEP